MGSQGGGKKGYSKKKKGRSRPKGTSEELFYLAQAEIAADARARQQQNVPEPLDLASQTIPKSQQHEHSQSTTLPSGESDEGLEGVSAVGKKLSSPNYISPKDFFHKGEDTQKDTHKVSIPTQNNTPGVLTAPRRYRKARDHWRHRRELASQVQKGKGQSVQFDPAAIIHSRAHPSLPDLKSTKPSKESTMSGVSETSPDASSPSFDAEKLDQRQREEKAAALAKSESKKSFEQEFNDRIRNAFGGGNKKKTAVSAVSQSSSNKSVVLPSTLQSFPQWSRLPEVLRAYILTFHVCTPVVYRPTYGQHSVYRVMDAGNPVPSTPVPLDFILGPRNKAFARDGLMAFYAGHEFYFDKPRESLFFLKQIGDTSLKNLRHLTIDLSRGPVPPSALNDGDLRLEKVWVNTLNYLVKRAATTGFDYLSVSFTQEGARLKPNQHFVPGTRMTMGDEDDHDPLHDFSDDVYRFGPTSYMYPTSIVNDIIRALIKIRGVAYPHVMLGTMAGSHWDKALMHTMRLPATEESEKDQVVVAIRAAWQTRVKMEGGNETGLFRRFKVD